MQKYSTKNNQIKLNFILITEHVSFIPDAILNCSHVLCVKRPVLKNFNRHTNKEKKVIVDVKQENLINLKEIYSFNLLKTSDDIPAENFNTICDIIISEMIIHKNAINRKDVKVSSPERKLSRFCDNTLCVSKGVSIADSIELAPFCAPGGTIKSADVIDVRKFRDRIYDILIYNLDALDCVWYIFTHFIKLDFFDECRVELMLHDISLFITRYGNNYRAIFHIESILFSMICNFRR
jgi:hypothetical protein